MGSHDKPGPNTGGHTPLEPSAREHGLDGYTEEAVGGFGESYQQQVAHGSSSASPGVRSESELDDDNAPPSGSPESLQRAVTKTLARSHIDAADLRVEVQGAAVALHGTVRHSSEKAELEARARAVPGVSSVTSELVVLGGARGQED